MSRRPCSAWLCRRGAPTRKQISNPDALYYLRAAEFFHDGQWQQGIAVYRWPFFSLIIAAVMALTGVTALVAAHTVNALFDCATVSCSSRWCDGSGLKSAQETSQRGRRSSSFCIPSSRGSVPSSVRDHGYYAFALLTLYLVVRDHQRAERWIKPSIIGCIVAAALFRLEALLLAVVTPAFYLRLAPRLVPRRLLSWRRLYWPGCFSLSSTRSGPVSWSVWRPRREGDTVMRFREIGDAMRSRAARLSEVVPPIRNAGFLAYVGFAVAALVDTLLRQ